MERRLTTILAADVVGYSRLMGADEGGTLAALKALRRDLIKPKEAQYHGRTVKLMGDGALMEFASVVDAVSFAVEVQVAMAEHNAEVPEDRRVVYRMGLNIGDVIIEGEDIYGDGVNVAARLEALAEPGGICISRNVYSQVKDKLDLSFEHLGEKEVKNIAEPVTVYRVALDDKAAALATPIVVPVPQRGRGRWPRIAAGMVLSVVAVVALVWWQARPPDVEPASVEAMAFPLPDRPSIAVLPFDNLSDDQSQDYFADGLTEDIITGLSRFPDLFVVARNSTFSYKGQQAAVKRIAEDLGVRYVLEGSVQEAADTIRVTAQLIDATTGHHLWAESYDRPLTDVFAVRDEVTQTIVATVMGDTGQLTRAEIARVSRKAPDNLRAYELVLKGVDIWLRFTPEANREAAALFEKSISIDPGYARAYAVLAWVHLNDYRWLWSEDPKRSLQLAYDMARKSVELDDTDDWSHWALGVVHLYRREYAPAEAAYRKALALNPNYADLLAHSGLFLTFLGKPDEAINRIKTAMRLNPYYRAWYPSLLGWAQYLLGDYDAAVASLKEAIDRNPDFLEAHQHLAATYTKLGRTNQARDEIARMVQMNPDISIAGIVRGLPFKNTKDLEGYLEGLRQAGLREEPPLVLPDKPSIAVLPFDNLSDDASQEYFADGMTEDLITDLSKLSGLFVISRNSSFAYKGKQVKVRQVAEDLGVRYVLEGSVRRVGDQVRINTQLIDAMTGGHVWAERYDGKLDNIFALQDAIMAKVVGALALTLTEKEREQRDEGPKTDSLEAYDLVLQARKLLTRFDHKAAGEARDLLQRAVELDPSYAEAHTLLGFYYFDEWEIWGRQRDKNLARALELATAAVELDPSDPAPHVLLAMVHQWRREFDKANVAADKALALQPNDAIALSNLGMMLKLAGRYEEALKAQQQAVRLDPFHPPNYLERLADAYAGVANYEQCVEVAERGVALDPDFVGLHGSLAVCYAALGKDEEAKAAVAEMRRTNPRFTLKTFAAYVPYTYERDLQRTLNLLRKAGVPEE